MGLAKLVFFTALKLFAPLKAVNTWRAAKTAAKVHSDPTPFGKISTLTFSLVDALLSFSRGGSFLWTFRSFRWLVSNARAAQKARRTLSYLQLNEAEERQHGGITLKMYQAAVDMHGPTVATHHPDFLHGLVFGEIGLRMHSSDKADQVKKFLDSRQQFCLDRCLKHFYASTQSKHMLKVVKGKWRSTAQDGNSMASMAVDPGVVEAAMKVLEEINKKHLLDIFDFIFL